MQPWPAAATTATTVGRRPARSTAGSATCTKQRRPKSADLVKLVRLGQRAPDRRGLEEGVPRHRAEGSASHRWPGRLFFPLDEDATGRGNTGLGISVMDESTGDPRPPTSLSGGETFYASLSLALGLADVVQSDTGGVSLETLFVDEGFGSLDTETLERVLDQLDQLKSGGRTIGVISHVSEMKDRFPDRIVVSREIDGPSRIIQTRP